jgi:hypothetical protein
MENSPAAARDNAWLEKRLRSLREQYFSDVAVENTLIVQFGRKARTRFGSITSKRIPGEPTLASLITINGLFIDPEVPDYVIDATLVHEFIHYTHGFHSPRRQMFEHPHRGGVIRKEFEARGAEHLEDRQNEWVKTKYKEYLQNHMRPRRRVIRRRRSFWR